LFIQSSRMAKVLLKGVGSAAMARHNPDRDGGRSGRSGGAQQGRRAPSRIRRGTERVGLC